MGKVIGIDLGTTNSCVAVMEGNQPIVIVSSDGARTTPSVVAFAKDGERLVGAVAKRQAVVNHTRTVQSIKREMGSDYRVKIDGKQYTPQEISAMILQKLKKDAEDYLGETVNEAVITVPAYFTDAQRQATKDAGRIAGLEVKRIINEPTAAALAYGIDKEQAQKIMVYDLGGGTFDVSVLDINSDVIEVLATAGNNRLGGDDFDQVITNYIAQEFKRTAGLDLLRDAAAMQRVREAAEKAKIELSSSMATTINLPFIAVGKEGPVHLEMQLTRAKFDDLTAHLVDATMGPVQQAMRDAGLSVNDLSKVLLVGGSSRIPAVQTAVKRFTGKEPFKGVNPDECVALGAAIQGGVMQGTVKSLLLLDVTPLSLGVETMGNVFSRIVERNTTIPVKRSQIFTTASPFQSAVDINVLQGEREIASANKSIGRFRLTGIKRSMMMQPQIEVTFSIDANGIVNVSACDKATGRAQEITITGSSNMSEADIRRAMEDAQRYAADDRRHKEESELRNRAEQLVYASDALLKQQKNQPRKAEIKEAQKRIQKAMRGKNPQELAAACSQMESIIGAGNYSAYQQQDYSGYNTGNTMNDDGSYDADVQE